MSIKHLQINETKIEARAECDNYDVADITNRWFSMIDSEMYNQMKNWNDIVPDASYGFLPTLGKLDVVLKDFDTINGKERPSFKIDSAKAIELLQGAGLYNEPHQCIRELLQNSVDATLLRVFVESEQTGMRFKNKEEFCKKCKDYPIRVSIKKEKIEKDKVDWSIRISDCGIGMSKNDLLYLTTTGGSIKNLEKRKIIERMPEWMRPSGAFGIGFQSVFLLTDTVKMETRKWNKEDVLNVTLFNPAREKEGAVLIQTSKDEHKPFGTNLEFEIVRESVPDISYVSSEYSKANQVFSSYDFVNDDSMDVDIAKIIDEVNRFAYASYIPIYIKLDNQSEVLLNKDGENNFSFFLEEKGLELSIPSANCFDHSSKIYYRNQIVSNSGFYMYYLWFKINILSGDAKIILTLNRDMIQSDYYPKLWKIVKDAVFEVLSKHYNEFNKELKQYASMFIDFYCNDEQKRTMFGGALPTEWKGLMVEGESCKKTMEEILKNKIIVLYEDFGSKSQGMILKQVDSNTLEIRYSHYRVFGNYDDLIRFITHKTINRKLRFYTKKKNVLCELTEGESEVIIDDWDMWFNLFLSHSGCDCARSLMPCVDKYKLLRIKEEAVAWRYRDYTFSKIEQKYPKMICPYIRVFKEANQRNLKISVSDRLYQFAYDNRFDESVTMDQIKETYQLFLDDMQQYVKSYLENT